MNVSLVVASVGPDRKAGWRTLDRAAEILFRNELRNEARDAFTYHDPLGVSVHVARNQAAYSAEGHWLLFVDPGDSLQGDYLGGMAAAERHLPDKTPPDYDRALLIPSVRRTVPGVLGQAARATTVAPDLERFHQENVCPLGTLVPMRLFTDLGGFDPAAADPDHDLWLRCRGAGASLLPVPAAVYVYGSA